MAECNENSDKKTDTVEKGIRSCDFKMRRREVVIASRGGKAIQKRRVQLKMARPKERKTSDPEE